ncbi:GNAT family N-acetyltransferase [Rothia dentocariosa]|uniref:GNAT family N-acetyltransferase n=1 Tax=Rothia dentocariosa TaxID=2047 RepID=UPI001EEC052A|nr:GNAT family N-acetyltransferase [Rothia dentocariosa]
MQYSILNAKNSLPSTEELVELYDAVGWSAYTRTPERLVPMLAESRYLYVARENTAEGTERLIGLVRAVGDGQTIAYIQDLLVHPQARRHGIGSALLGKSSPISTGKAFARGSSLQIL